VQEAKICKTFHDTANTTGLSPDRVHAALETAYGETGTCPSAYSVGAAGPLPYGPSPDGGHASDPPPGDGNPAGRKAASPLHYWRELGSSSDQSNVPTATEWTPCDGCKKEFDKLICQKREVDEVASKIGKSSMFISFACFLLLCLPSDETS
jgi:hypothetical protein